MTFEEILKENGIEDAKPILDKMHEEGVFLSKEENLDIRYSKLKEQNDGNKNKLDEANSTIAQLKKDAKDSAKLQATITQYETKIKDLEEQQRQAEQMQKINGALLKAGAEDLDYLNYKLSHKENFNIDNLESEIKELKNNNPKFFKKEEDKKFIENKLKEGESEKISKEDFDKFDYQKRAELKATNPELYNNLRESD